MTIDRQTLRWNGWGPVDQPNALPEGAPQWDWLKTTLGLSELPKTPAKRLTDIEMPARHLSDQQVGKLQEIVGDNQVRIDDYERAFHARGKSYHDLLHLRAGRLGIAPDAVVYPRTADEVLALVQYCAREQISLIPYGGGSSVVGGVNAQPKSPSGSVVTLDMTQMSRILKIDSTSMTATIEAGIYGPHLEKALAEHGYTLGHYPQSFEYSTLGGWIAARGAGQQSNRYGKAEKWLVSARLATPGGFWTTEQSPASAAGPNLNQLVAGSEGTLGVICEATVKIHREPALRDYRGYLFKSFETGLQVIRGINQAEIPVAMLRLSDASETYFFQKFGSSSGSGLKSALQNAYLRLRGFDKSPCLMLIGLEGDSDLVGFSREHTGLLCNKAGALSLGTSAGQRWFHGRFSSPYARDPLMDHGLGVDTLETSTRWSNITTLHRAVTDAIDKAMAANMPSLTARGICMAHVSHSYLDGASLYFTFVFPRTLDAELEQWQAIKRAATDAIMANGGTLTHHHGVGTDHAAWMSEEKGATGMAALRAVKRELDPDNILNPGKLLG